LPPMPEEHKLWAPLARKGPREDNRNSLTHLTESIMVLLDSKRPPHQFHISSLAGDCDEDIKRVYTICNVFEGLEAGARRGKDVFEWRGLEGMELCLGRLKGKALERGLGSKYFSLLKRETALSGKEQGVKMNVTMITQSLLMLLTVLPKGTLLDLVTAALLLLGPSSGTCTGYNTMKLREVAHVLQALLLVKPVPLPRPGKPLVGFLYTGPQIEPVLGDKPGQLLKGLELLEAQLAKQEDVEEVSSYVLQLDQDNNVIQFEEL